ESLLTRAVESRLILRTILSFANKYGLVIRLVIGLVITTENTMKIRIALGIVVLASQLSVAQSTFHGNLARTGVYDSAGPMKFGGVKWTFKTGGPIVASPAIADGVVYIPSADSYLYAIDQETGKEKWKFKSRMPIASSPAVAGRTLYFVSSAGSLGAIDVANGKIKW